MTTTPSTLSENIPLQTVGENGKAPKFRIASAEDAVELVEKLVEANRERSRMNAKVKGQLDGNPPYSPEKLRHAGQAYRANINFGEAKAALSTALAPYYELFAGATYYYNVQTSFGGPDDKTYFSGIITEEFDKMLKAWDGFDPKMQMMLHDFIAFGKGYLFWRDPKSWRFEFINQWRLLVPDGTPADLEQIEVFVIRERMLTHKLWALIEDKEAAKAIGWDVSETVKAISLAFPEKLEGDTQWSYELLQQKFKDRDITEGTRSSTVPVANIFVKEFGNKVSHLIVCEEVQGSSGKTMPTGYLFKNHKYDSFKEALNPFFFEVLDGSWNGASGLGKDIYAMMAIKDRLKCSVVDLVFLKCGISLKATSANALQKTQLVQAGVFNIIPDGYEVQEATILGDAKSGVDADVYLDNVLQNNTGVYRARQQKSQGNPITAEQARNDQINSAVLGNSAVNRFYRPLDSLGTEMLRRATMKDLVGDDEETKAAKEFQKRCLDRGVPREALDKIESVKAYRNVGNGSLLMRKQAMMDMMALYQLLPENGKQNLIEDQVATIAGCSMVERYAPRAARAKLPTDHEAQAALENAAIKQGAPVVWTPTQNNTIHAQVHLQAGASAASTLEQGADMAQVAAFLNGIGQHVAIHLQKISEDPTRKEVFKVLNQQFQQLAQLTDKLNAQLQKQAEEQKKQQMEAMRANMQAKMIESGMDPETRVKMAEAQVDMKLKEASKMQQLRHKEEKHQQQLAQNVQDAEIKDMQAAAQIYRDKALTEAQIQKQTEPSPAE